MSDDGPYDDWEDEVNEALDASEIGDKPDVTEYLDFHDSDQEEIDYWTEIWDSVPYDLSENQYQGIAETLMDWDGDYDMLMDWIDADFWDWYRENYEGS